MDPLVRKAWKLCQQTAPFRLQTILKATIWLEEKYHQAPDAKLAMVIALHYLILAVRRESSEPEVTKEYLARAMHWREEASRRAWRHPPTEPQNGN